MKKIDDFLKHLGLSDAETKIYSKLLEIGQCSVTELAHSLSMNRVTAHFNIQSLIDKGLITHVKQGRERELTAQSPETLKYLIEQKEKETLDLRQEFITTLPLLIQSMPTKDKSAGKFDVKFYEGKNGVRAIYRELLKSNEIRSYCNISTIFEVFPENSQLFPDAQRNKTTTYWEIIEDSTRSREYIRTFDPKRYNYKFYPSKWQIYVFDYLIFDGKIAMISAKEELDGILITNDNMYENAKSIFEMLWSLLPDPK